MKRLTPVQFAARCEQALMALDPDRVPPMSRDELAAYHSESSRRMAAAWSRITNPAMQTADLFARIQSDNRPYSGA